MAIISEWEYVADHGHCRKRECKCPEHFKYGLCYYINDANAGLSPVELHKKLLSLTTFQEKTIIVKDCVMVSEVPKNHNENKPIRFFFKINKEISIENLKQKIIDTFKLNKIMIADTQNNLSGYGYAYLSDESKKEQLLENAFDVDEEINIFFDAG
jgi:hypothetical protein